MSNNRKDTKKLKITFINPNSNKSFEELLRIVIIEKIKNSNKYQLIEKEINKPELPEGCGAKPVFSATPTNNNKKKYYKPKRRTKNTKPKNT